MANNTKLKPGESVPIEEKLTNLFEIREMIEQGFASVTTIAKKFQITPATASAWRKQALQMIAKDDNGYTREGIRNIQIGRIQYHIDRLQHDLDNATGELKYKIHDRIVKYYDSLHRITGLNIEQVNVNVNERKPLQIVRTNTPASTDSSVIEGTITPPTT